MAHDRIFRSGFWGPRHWTVHPLDHQWFNIGVFCHCRHRSATYLWCRNRRSRDLCSWTVWNRTVHGTRLHRSVVDHFSNSRYGAWPPLCIFTAKRTASLLYVIKMSHPDDPLVEFHTQQSRGFHVHLCLSLLSCLCQYLCSSKWRCHFSNIKVLPKQSHTNCDDLPYSHVGIVYIQDGNPMFLKQRSVLLTPLQLGLIEGLKINHGMRPKKELSKINCNLYKKAESTVERNMILHFNGRTTRCIAQNWFGKITKKELASPFPANQFQDYDFTHPDVYPLVQKRWSDDINLRKVVHKRSQASNKLILSTLTSNSVDDTLFT